MNIKEIINHENISEEIIFYTEELKKLTENE